MIQPNDIAILEKYDAMISAEAGADMVNGTVGKVTSGVFAAAAAGDCFAYQKEKGDFDEEFVIKAGEDVRLVVMSELEGRLVKISPDHLASGSFAVGSKYISNANGKLVASNSPSSPYFEVVELINYDGAGARAKIGVATA